MARPISGRRIMARAVKGFTVDVRDEFARVADQVGGLLLRSADADGAIPLRTETIVINAAGAALDRLFVGADGRSAFGQDGVTALAPYPYLLNKWYVNVVAATVRSHQAWMQRNVPEDVYNWLAGVPSRPVPMKQAASLMGEMAQADAPLISDAPLGVPTMVRESENPFVRRDGESDAVFTARLERLRIFLPNPLAEYDPMHFWVDPRGYRLSDRIWERSAEARRRLDILLRDSIREGMGARELAKLAEQWLLPGRRRIRTKKPYGTDGSFDAMRLARTEIAQAANQAAYIAACLNPYVGGVDIARSANGDPLCKVCPEHATIDLQQERVRDPYPIGAAPVPTFHPHCVTPGQLVETRRGAIPIEDVVVGDYALTHTGQYQKVVDIWERAYSGPVCIIEIGNGQFELTPQHSVLTPAGWTHAQCIGVGGQVSQPGGYIGLLNTVQRMMTRHYTGMVYNLHVARDDSYTVNGAVVHNCMCRVQPVVADDPATVTAMLRAVMVDAQAQYLEPYITPAQADTFIMQILGLALMNLLAQVDQLPLL